MPWQISLGLLFSICARFDLSRRRLVVVDDGSSYPMFCQARLTLSQFRNLSLVNRVLASSKRRIQFNHSKSPLSRRLLYVES